MLASGKAIILRMSRAMICLLVVATWQAPASAEVIRTLPFPTQVIFSARGDSLNGEKNVRITDFAISPDGRKVAVEFEVPELSKQPALWLAEWDLGTGKSVAQTRLVNSVSATPGVDFAGFFHSGIQYSPDGARVIVRAGNAVYGLGSSNLGTLYSIAATNENNTNIGPFWQASSISADGASLAVLIGQSELPAKSGTVYIYDAIKGGEKARWSAPAQVLNLSLSQDGKYTLLTVAHYSSDILLVDSSSGVVIRSFVSGFGHIAGRAAAEALFLDQDHFIATAVPWEKPSSFAAKIFNSATGKVKTQLMFEHSGWSQNMWLSGNRSMIAVLKTWNRKKQLAFGEGGGSKNAEIVFFHVNEPRPFCTVGPLPEKRNEPSRTSGFVRFSRDLNVLGLFVNNSLSLYSLAGCD